MNSDIAIRVEGLGKKYLIGHQNAERGTTFREALVQGTRNVARMGRDMLRGRALVAGDTVEEFWALRDVNFEIKRGDVVGVIGRNGAGKSTLLKVLSRITEPTLGRVAIHGRVASLLEVGTGFHPELTGRENIYLNGAILGMTRTEIRRKFDEIVAFAEVERFLDTPVKRYSSGMYVRLAFGVAAHLEPEILVVDEVLAVGDAEFQKRCLGKMREVANGGRTVLFVSHNMGAISSLCARGLYLQSGQLLLDAPVMEVVSRYAAAGVQMSRYAIPDGLAAPSVHIATADLLLDGENALIQLCIRSDRRLSVIVNARIRDGVGAPVGMSSLGGFEPSSMATLEAGLSHITMRLELPTLANGSYSVDLDLELPYSNFLHRVNDCLTFEVLRKPRSTHGRTLQAAWNVGPLEIASQLVRPPINSAGASLR